MQAVGPFIIAIWDSWRFRRKLEKDSDTPWRAYDAVLGVFTHGPTRYLLPTLLLSWSGDLTAVVSSTPRSTFICPGVLPYKHTVPTFQWLGVFLECFIFIAIAELCASKTSDGSRRSSRGPFILGWIFIVSSSHYRSGLSPSDLR